MSFVNLIPIQVSSPKLYPKWIPYKLLIDLFSVIIANPGSYAEDDPLYTINPDTSLIILIVYV